MDTRGGEPCVPSEHKHRHVTYDEEGIQDHLPVALPCYDFIQIEDPLLGAPLPKVKVTTSKLIDFPNVTGGVYKARERIHRCMADQRLLAIPTSWRRVAASNPNLE